MTKEHLSSWSKYSQVMLAGNHTSSSQMAATISNSTSIQPFLLTGPVSTASHQVFCFKHWSLCSTCFDFTTRLYKKDNRDMLLIFHSQPGLAVLSITTPLHATLLQLPECWHLKHWCWPQMLLSYVLVLLTASKFICNVTNSFHSSFLNHNCCLASGLNTQLFQTRIWVKI